MTTVSVTDLTNAKTDVDHIAAIATSTALTATDRLGTTKKTLQGAINSISAITDRGSWTTATAYAVKDVVLDTGVYYICITAHTSGGTFAGDSAKWRVYQGDLGAYHSVDVVNDIRGNDFSNRKMIRIATERGNPVYYLDSADTVSADDDFLVVHDSASNRWKLVHDGTIDVRWAGAVGDGLTTKTDNKAKIIKAFSALASSGGTVKLTPSSVGNSYYTADSISIEQSNTTLWIDTGVELFCDNNTTDGHTFAFIHRTAGSQYSNCHVVGGGTVRNTAPGSNENAIGFARISNYSCVGMNVPTANKKGITAQVDCDNGYIARNVVGTTGSDGIAIEGDGAGATEENNKVTILNNIVENATGIGVNVTFAAGPDTVHVVTGGNIVKASTSHSFAFSGCNRIEHLGGDVAVNSTGRGFSYLNCDDISGHIFSLKSGNQSAFFDGCGGDISTHITSKDSSFGSSNTYDAIVVQNPASTHKLSTYVSGATHKSSLNSISATSFPVHITDHNIINDGVTSRFLGTQPYVDNGNKLVRLDFADLDTTPDVANGELFKALNTGATTITDFSGAYPEKIIEVFFVTTNTTLQHAGGSTLRLKGAVNVTPGVGTMMTFRFTSGLWYEVSRSF